MANEYLARGSDSLAAINWRLQDGTAGSGFVNGATLIVPESRTAIVNDIDWSALNGVESFEVLENVAAPLGGPAAPVKFDADASGTSKVTYAGSSTFYYQAAGNSNVCTNFLHGGSGRSYLVGGTFTNVRLSRGVLEAKAASVVTNFYAQGGSSVIEYNATPLTVLDIDGGTHTTNRACASILVRSGTLVYDVTTAETTSSAFTVHPGATLILVSCRATIGGTANVYGTLDPSKLKAPVTITSVNMGARGFIKDGNKLTVSARVPQFLPAVA